MEKLKKEVCQINEKELTREELEKVTGAGKAEDNHQKSERKKRRKKK
jgi:hypothetical protein